jgi:hypothetical protein
MNSVRARFGALYYPCWSNSLSPLHAPSFCLPLAAPPAAPPFRTRPQQASASTACSELQAARQQLQQEQQRHVQLQEQLADVQEAAVQVWFRNYKVVVVGCCMG